MEENLSHQRELLDRNVTRILDRERSKLATSLERLNALNPLAVLERGYSAVRNKEGTIVPRVSLLNEGEEVTLLMQDGTAQARVLSKTMKNNGGSHGKSKG